MGNIHTAKPLKDLSLDQLEEIIRGVIISDPWNSHDDPDDVKYAATVEYMRGLGVRPVTALEYSMELRRAAASGGHNHTPKILVWRQIEQDRIISADSRTFQSRREHDHCEHKMDMSRDEAVIVPSKRLCVEICPVSENTSKIIISGRSDMNLRKVEAVGHVGHGVGPWHSTEMNVSESTTEAPTEVWIRK